MTSFVVFAASPPYVSTCEKLNIPAHLHIWKFPHNLVKRAHGNATKSQVVPPSCAVYASRYAKTIDQYAPTSYDTDRITLLRTLSLARLQSNRHVGVILVKRKTLFKSTQESCERLTCGVLY